MRWAENPAYVLQTCRSFQLILTKEGIWALLSRANLRADALQSECGLKPF